MEEHHFFNLIDFLFGRLRYSQQVMGVHNVRVNMPEGDYPAVVEVFIAKWERRRWPFPTYESFALIMPTIPIPQPFVNGDEGGIQQMYCPNIGTPEEAVNLLRTSIQRDRVRYGGKDWMPALPSKE